MSTNLEKARQEVPRFPIWPRLPEHRLLVLLDALVDCLQAGQWLQFFRGPWAKKCPDLISLLEVFSERSAKIAIQQMMLRFKAETPSPGMFLVGQEEPAESAERTQLEVEFVESALPELVSALHRVAAIVASAPAETCAENCAHWIRQKYRLCSSDGAVLEFDAYVGYPRFVRDGDGVGMVGDFDRDSHFAPRYGCGRKIAIGCACCCGFNIDWRIRRDAADWRTVVLLGLR